MPNSARLETQHRIIPFSHRTTNNADEIKLKRVREREKKSESTKTITKKYVPKVN